MDSNTINPSEFVTQRLDSFMNLFSFIKEVQEGDDVAELPSFAFRLVPSEGDSVNKTLSAVLENFPYFMLTRVFPYFHYYYDDPNFKQVTLTIGYFDYFVRYLIDTNAMQLACPSNILDLQSCKESIKNSYLFLDHSEGISEISMSKATLYKKALEEHL